MDFGLFARIRLPLALLLSVFVVGTLGYYLLALYTGQSASLLDCAYMTSITLTTVGYSDSLGLTTTTAGKLYTMFLIVAGMGATLYSVSSLTAFIVEGQVGHYFQEKRMQKRISELTGHTIICGAGRTGTHVIEEHLSLGNSFVVVDNDEHKLEALREHHGNVLTLLGDATREEVLQHAGIEKAASLVAALGTDKDNLYLLVSARYLESKLNIVVRCLDHDAEPKFVAAGATSVVSPTYLGGLRLAAQVLQPRVVDFLDGMLRTSGDTCVTEAVVQEHSELAGKTLVESRLAEKVGLLVVALRQPDSEQFIYSPKGTTVLEAGSVVVVIGPRIYMQKLEILTGEKAA